MGIAKQAAMLRAARNSASIRSYHPAGTVKCEGVRLFRSQPARDVGCILDVNPSVTAWRCMPSADSDLKPAGIPINYRPPFRFEAGHYSNQLPAGSRL